MTVQLQRITTEYVDVEDRLRLSGKTGSGETVVLWLTRQLLERLLPHLFQWLEGQGETLPWAELLQGFAQESARAQFEPQAPVKAEASAASWLVTSVDLTPAHAALGLTFRGGEGEAVSLNLEVQPLRQWLNILLDQYRKGEWPLAVWPEWMDPRTAVVRPGQVALH